MSRYVYKAKPDAAPWDRQDGEGAAAWSAFQIYRDLGSGRTIKQVAERLQRSPTHIGDYSIKFHWQDRIAAWEAELDRLARAENVAAILDMRKNHAGLATDMLAKAAEGLDRIAAEDLKAQDICRLVEIGAKLERIARGDVGEVVENREGEALEPVVFFMPTNGRDEPEECLSPVIPR